MLQLMPLSCAWYYMEHCCHKLRVFAIAVIKSVKSCIQLISYTLQGSPYCTDHICERLPKNSFMLMENQIKLLLELNKVLQNKLVNILYTHVQRLQQLLYLNNINAKLRTSLLGSMIRGQSVNPRSDIKAKVRKFISSATFSQQIFQSKTLRVNEAAMKSF